MFSFIRFWNSKAEGCNQNVAVFKASPDWFKHILIFHCLNQSICLFCACTFCLLGMTNKVLHVLGNFLLSILFAEGKGKNPVATDELGTILPWPFSYCLLKKQSTEKSDLNPDNKSQYMDFFLLIFPACLFSEHRDSI